MSEEKLIIFSDDFTVEEVRMIRAALRDLGLTTRMSLAELKAWRKLSGRINVAYLRAVRVRTKKARAQ